MTSGIGEGDVPSGSRRSGNRRKVTIREIAQAANVSLSTVSRALRNDPRANRDTAAHVLRIAAELNYYPDSLAKGLRQNRTDTIGIILNDLNNPFYSEILSGIGETLNRLDYALIISYSHYDAEQERKNIITMLSKRVDGIILSPIHDETANIGLLRDSGVPFVLVDCFPVFEDASYVYSEHGNGATVATDYLIARGHRDILVMMGRRNGCMAEEFVKGYSRALGAAGIPLRPDLIVPAGDISIQSGYELFKSLLSGNGATGNLEFTAVLAISDLLAIGVYKAANELGFRIPDDYSIVGYDDIEFASVLAPPLTTIDQPRKQIGAESVQLLLDSISSGEAMHRRKAFPPRLVKRGSVRNILR